MSSARRSTSGILPTKSGYTATHGWLRGLAAVELSVALIGAGVLQTILYLLFIRAIDLYEREPLRYVVPVFAWGFAVATTISLVFNTLAALTFEAIATRQVAGFLTAVFVAPVVEETTKGLALLIIFIVADRKSTRLNSSHANISYAVFCLKKK